MMKYTTQMKLVLVVFGELFLPDYLTNLIKINPTQYWIKGDVIPFQKGLVRKDNKVRYRQDTIWEFSTGFVETLDFEEVSMLFEKNFSTKIPVLKSYIEENDLSISLNIVLEIADEVKPSIHFNKEIIKICQELNAEIDIDMYLLRND